ncbi:MAG: DNA mismatch repair endonuclease MutL [Lachnospiraceae bacterium]|nr:DNA mismatch repair endonuclease MutL [Lachnospiraceae bacterium]
MNTIEILDKNTIDKIAAGEVVERPASIVKELVENSIDSGASAINIEIKDGGISFIRITDNGSGIEADQIKKAFLRHSTSKLRSVEDLTTIHSLGFRGEALSSISAISKVELITKVSGSLTGVRYVIEGGEEKTYQEIGAPDGTTIIIRDVFYNTPARKKFLKSPGTEGSYIASLVERLALSHPDISFNYIQNNATKLHTAGNGSVKDIAYSVFGKEITGNMIPINVDNGYMRLMGYVCKPIVSRGNRNYENYFVNGRFVKNNIITKGIEDAYKSYMMQHRYPFTLLMLDINGTEVDVNVHPAKQEVRFDNGELIYSTVYKSIYEAISQMDLIPEISFTREKEEEKPQIKTPRPAEPFEQRRIEEEVPAFTRADTKQAEEVPASKPLFVPKATVKPVQLTLDMPEFEEKARPEITIIGQVFDTYWVIQYDEKMYIIDQHAAHEKVKYERIIKNLKNRTFESQLLSPPIVITLSSSEEETLKTYRDTFANLGFEISPFGGNEYIISAVPMDVYSLDFKDVFIEILDNLNEGNTATPDIINDRIATMSCKAAVKGNNTLSVSEAKALISEMFTLEDPFNCPHGRPTVISISKYEMEKHFKRII